MNQAKDEREVEDYGVLQSIANAIEQLEESGDIKCNLPDCGDVGCASSILWSALFQVLQQLPAAPKNQDTETEWEARERVGAPPFENQDTQPDKQERPWEERFDTYFYDSEHSLTPRQVAHIKKCLVAPLIAAAEERGRKYSHMCRDGHEEIGHNDSEHELCPLCRALNDIAAAERRAYERVIAVCKEKGVCFCSVCQLYNEPYYKRLIEELTTSREEE